ncbi:PREDICTED: probable ubiquitin-like-specific protease 2A isoform X2 [Ipomoea nil]|uniref:probable ubiquitin-like-specific protease 2A isoform X2 n=1 Tax=Ipomoea nil TaxID=35883 RepID=UPI000900EC3C|nr:PREDICTED: probable ubiquitin-like-specific protease 2A isoform X2 [Ipomoea nil]
MTKTKGRSSPSPRKSKFAAFEFTAEDERVEKDSRIKLRKFKKTKSPQKHSPISKYTFLNSFARGLRGGLRGVKNILNEFVDELVNTGSSDGPMDVEIIKSDTVASSGSSGCKPSEQNRTEYHGSEFSSLATTTSSARLSGIVTDDKHVCSSPPLIPADNEPVVVDSDDDPVIELRSPKSPSIAQLQGLPDEHALKYSSNVHDTVVVITDHIIYRHLCSTSSCLSFSPKCITLEAIPISETMPLTFKWKVSAVVDIQSVWIDSVKTAAVTVRLISKTQKSRAVRILSFAVCDPDWPDRQEAIQSLDFRYKDRWRTTGGETVGSELFLGQERFSPSSTSFPIFEESFNEVIYPKGDPDAISISKRDVDRLQPETFINDTIVDFYITYLKNKIPSEEKHRFHFFNCFFFRKLTDLDKDPSQACEGRAAFQRVRRWTMKVDIFKKDYIFVPINFSYHWSLIVICHPGEVAGYRDNEMEKSSRVPCILHMDSLRGSHKGLKNLFQSYLWEEWKERHGELAEDMRRKFFNLQFVHLKLPQQENLFDCGLFLLHYVELFLEQAPVNFSPAGITESSKFLSKDWFQPKDVSYKRDHIRKLIYEILKHSRDDCSTDSDYEHSSNSKNKEHAGVEFVNELCSSRETSQINDFHSPADADVQILSPPRTHVKSLKFAGGTDLVPGDLSPQGDTPKPAPINNYMHSGQKLTSRGSITMSPIEEEEETGEEFMDFSPALKRGRRQQIEHFELCPVNEDIKPSFGMKTGGLSMSSQVCPGEEVNVETSSSSDEESEDCIVVDSQGEIDTCDDIHHTSECSFRQKTNTCFHLSLEADSPEHEANHIQSYMQEEEQARPKHLPEIIEVSGSDTEDKGECLVTSTAESAAYIVEDSDEDEDNVERSMNHRMQPLLRSKPGWKTEIDDECGLIAKLKMNES